MLRPDDRTSRLRARAVVAAVVASTLVAALVAAVAAPASAFQTDRFVVEHDKPAKATFGPIAGQYAATPAAVPEPSDCGDDDNTAPLQGACDRVPVRIVPPPSLGPTEDFLVTITISWNPSGMVEDPSGEVGDTPADDIDVYFYDNQQIGKREDPDSTKWTNLGESTEFGGPETIKLFSPGLGDYNLVVVNVTGPNIDYTVEAKVEIDGFESPFEDLGPAFGVRRPTAARNDASDNLIAPADFSGGDDGPSGPRPGSPAAIAELLAGGRALDAVPVLPDNDFASFATGSTFESELAAPSPFGAGRPDAVVRPGKVAPALAIFWLAFVPLALLAALVVVMLRRSRGAFNFA